MRISSRDFEARREVGGGAGPVDVAPSLGAVEVAPDVAVVEGWVVAVLDSAGFAPNKLGADAVVADGCDIEDVSAGFAPNKLGAGAADEVAEVEAGAPEEGVEGLPRLPNRLGADVPLEADAADAASSFF